VAVGGRRRFALLAAVLVALNAFFWLAQSGFALPAGIVQTLLGSRMVRAEVVWMNSGKVEDTRLDRGVITAIATTAPASITLKERDGTVATIPLSTSATVHVGAGFESLDQLKKGTRVVVSRPATGAADTIQVEGVGP
jgi:hypothetical protein